MSFSVNDCRANGGGSVGIGCVGEVFSPGTSLCGTGLLFDRPERLARHAIEHVEESLLARLRDDVDVASVVPDGEELRRLREDRSPTDRDGRSGSATGACPSSHRARRGCCRTGCRRCGCRRRSRTAPCRTGCTRCRAPHRPSARSSCGRRRRSRARLRATCRRRLRLSRARCGTSTRACPCARRRRACRRGSRRTARRRPAATG